MRYLQRLNTLPPDEADSPLILGTALHTGIEESLEAAVKKYCSSYPIITDEHINEVIKLEHVIPLARAGIPPGGAFEVPIMDKDFVGYIDYLVPINKVDGTEYFDLYDFKYSNKALDEYEEDNNPILGFFKECEDEDFHIEDNTTDLVYSRYQEYCLANNLQAMSKTAFSRQIARNLHLHTEVRRIGKKTARFYVAGNQK